MSYQEAKSLLMTSSSAVILGTYLWVVFNRLEGLPSGPLPDTDTLLRFWAAATLVFIPVSVVARIVIMILFAIIYRMVTGQDLPTFEDERDKLIELKSTRVSQAIFVLVFVLSMVPVVTGYTVTVMFLTLLLGGFFAELVGEIGRISMYRRGV